MLYFTTEGIQQTICTQFFVEIMTDESVIFKDFKCGKLIFLRSISRFGPNVKHLLKIMTETMNIPMFETQLQKMGFGLHTCTVYMRRIIENCYKFVSGTIVSVVLNSIPLLIAVVHDKGIGRSVLMEIGNTVGSLIGCTIRTLIVDAFGSLFVPLIPFSLNLQQRYSLKKQELERLFMTKQNKEGIPTRRELEDKLRFKKDLEGFPARELRRPLMKQELKTKQELERLLTKRELERLCVKSEMEQQFKKNC